MNLPTELEPLRAELEYQQEICEDELTVLEAVRFALDSDEDQDQLTPAQRDAARRFLIKEGVFRRFVPGAEQWCSRTGRTTKVRPDFRLDGQPYEFVSWQPA